MAAKETEEGVEDVEEDDDTREQRKHLYSYGCGYCPFGHENLTDTECRDCSADECNQPHIYWNMTFVPPPTKPPKPIKVFVPFKEHRNFPEYEEIAERFIWAFPVAVLALFVSGAVFVWVRVHVQIWYYWCVRYWE